jgi:hypothetical protein
MAKTKISEFDVDPSNNTDINSINIAEGCAPSGINNAIRQLMSDLKEQQTGASGDNFTVGGNLAVTGTSAFTGATTFNGAVVFSSTVTGLGTMSAQNKEAVDIEGGTIDATVIGGGTAAAGTFTTATATTVALPSNWTVTVSDGKLTFSSSGTAKASIDSSGNLIVSGNVTAYGTP